MEKDDNSDLRDKAEIYGSRRTAGGLIPDGEGGAYAPPSLPLSVKKALRRSFASAGAK